MMLNKVILLHNEIMQCRVFLIMFCFISLDDSVFWSVYSVGEAEVPYRCTASLLLSIALFASVHRSYSGQTLSDLISHFTCSY